MLVATLLLFTLMLANLPFLNERLLACIPLKSPIKHFGWRCVEMIILYLSVGGVALLLEIQQGPVHRQHWQFYVATCCLFLVFAFPGMVIRYFWRKPGM